MLATGFAFLALAAVAAARQCQNFLIPITVEAQTIVFNYRAPQTQLDVTAFVLNVFRLGSTFVQQITAGSRTTRGSYDISAQYCQPDTIKALPYVQILTHGVGFDKSYWDIPYDNYNYSYVNSALDAGYATLAYDRLGVGRSSHGDPVNEIQFNLELAALREITAQVRQGEISQIKQKFDNRIVHVGHSFGSEQTFAFSALYPNETSGIVLTAFSLNGSFAGLFMFGAGYTQANTNEPLRFGPGVSASSNTGANISAPGQSGSNIAYNYPNGYLTNSDTAAQEALFFSPPYFDPMLLWEAENSLKQPVAVGELLTNGVAGDNMFRGPVLVITGDADLPFCGGNCLATGVVGTSIPANAGAAFGAPANTNFTSYIQPHAGHGLNAHYNSTGAYAVIQRFLEESGLN